MRKILSASLFVAVLSAPLFAQPALGSLGEVNAALQTGQADLALRLLNVVPPSAEAHNLRCRVLFSLEHWNAAADECEWAVTMDPQNSDNHLWLGRALGEKASRASFMSAFSLASRVRTEFEQAVRLNPENAPALADLGEFYYDAPGVVGGGSDKAEVIAAELEKVDPARAHELRGRIAEKHNDLAAAERELKQAVALSRHPAFQWMVLASFHSRHDRWTDMDSAIQSGLKAAHEDSSANVALFNAGSMLNRTNRNPELAARLFQAYLAGTPKTEEAPAFVAHVRLARIEARLGDISSAKRDRAAALELAHDYEPARELQKSIG